MSWLTVVLAGIVCGLAGAGLTILASESIIRIFRISTFEGAAGYFVVFLLVPLGFLVGLVTGIVLFRVQAPSGPVLFLGYQLLGILVTVGLLTIGYGAVYLSRDRPLSVGGASLWLEVECRYRPTPGEDPRDEILNASLYVTEKDNSYIDIDLAQVEEREGWLVVPSPSALRSRSASRVLTVNREGQRAQSFDVLLPPTPTLADTAWTDWLTPRPPSETSPGVLDPARACEIRYRVRFGHPSPGGAETSPTTPTFPRDVPVEDGASPESTVRTFLEQHFAGEMAFSPATVGSKRGQLSTELGTRLDDYFARNLPDDEPPPIDGDPFTDSQEYPTRFEVLAPEAGGGEGRVPVRFEDGPRTRTVTFVLRLVERRWFIDDLIYEDGSTLRDLLRS